MTGTFYTNQNYSANGAVLQYRPDRRDWWYEAAGQNSIPIVRLYYENTFHDPDYPLNAWVLEISNYYDIDGVIETYNYQLTGGLGNPNDFNIPVWRARSNFYELGPFLSAYAVQPTVQFLNGTGLGGFIPPISPTPTPTVTPTTTPTISLTPTITPTISLTPSNTPTTTPTISITPTITPTISITPTITNTVTPTRPTPTPTTTSRTDTLPFSSLYLSAFGFYGNMEGVENGISYDLANIPLLLQKLSPPYNYVWEVNYPPYECSIGISTVGYPVRNSWILYLSQQGEYGFGIWTVATNSQSVSAIPLKNWTLSPGSSGGVIILNG